MAATQEIQNGAAPTNGATAPAAETAVVFSSFKPKLVVEAPKAADAVAFYKAAFGAEEIDRVMHPKRKAEQEQPLLLSAQLKLASSVFSVSDFAGDDTPLVKNEGTAAAAATFTLETEDVQAALTKAVTAGAVAEGEITESESGARVAKLKDPYGFLWTISSVAKTTLPIPSEPAAAPADAQA